MKKYLIFRLERLVAEHITESCFELIAEFHGSDVSWQDELDYKEAVAFATKYSLEHGLRTTIITAPVFGGI